MKILKILIPVMILFTCGYYFIYHSNYYLETYSHKLSFAGENDTCESSFICKDGYYEVSYPTHKKIFHYRYRDLIISSFSSYITFLDEADPSTFIALGREYATDKNNFFFTSERVNEPSVKLNTLKVVSGFDFYARDSDSVYFRGKKLEGAISSDFTFLDKQSKDSISDRLFSTSNGKIFNGDSQVKFILDGVFNFSSPKNAHSFPCDNQVKNNNYYTCNLTEFGKSADVEIDLNSFRVLPHKFTDYVTYAVDKNHVYYCGTRIGCSSMHIVHGADPNTFISKSPEGYYYIAEDKNNEYAQGCILYKGVRPQQIERGNDYADTLSSKGSCTYHLD
jgi:hypothetical protein